MEDAMEAKEKLAGAEVDGHRVRVDYSITKRAHTPTPGIYMGTPSQSRGYSSRYSRRSPSPYRGYRGRYRDSPPRDYYGSVRSRFYDDYDRYERYDRFYEPRYDRYSPYRGGGYSGSYRRSPSPRSYYDDRRRSRSVGAVCS